MKKARFTAPKLQGNLTSLRLKQFFALMLLTIVCFDASLMAQQSATLTTGLTELESNAITIRESCRKICYAIAVIAALIGALRVMGKQSGERENLHKEISGWFGSAIFFAVAGFVVDRFMGI
jgi:hypothetical protein